MCGVFLLAGAAVVVPGSFSRGEAAARKTGDISQGPLTAGERSLLFQAEQVLLRDCMRRNGFSYSVVDDDPVPEQREFPYGIHDAQWARSHGYGRDIGRKTARVKKEDPNQRYFNGPRPEGLTARTPSGYVLTRSTERCRTASQGLLYGGAGAWFQSRASVDDLGAIRVQRVLADPAYRRAPRPWSTCMRGAGHPYASPEKARVAMTASPAVSAEADCMRSSGLAGVAKRLDARHDQSLRQKYGDVVATKTALQAEALPWARRIAGEARP